MVHTVLFISYFNKQYERGNRFKLTFNEKDI